MLICLRERNDGLYRPITYLVAKMVEEMSIFFFLSLILTAIVFAPCKLGGSYILFWLVNFVTTAIGIGKRPHVNSACGFLFTVWTVSSKSTCPNIAFLGFNSAFDFCSSTSFCLSSTISGTYTLHPSIWLEGNQICSETETLCSA